MELPADPPACSDPAISSQFIDEERSPEPRSLHPLDNSLCSSPSLASTGRSGGSLVPRTPMAGMTAMSPMTPCTPGIVPFTPARGMGTPGALASPAGECNTPAGVLEGNDQSRVTVLVEFLRCLLDMVGRSVDQLLRSKHPPDRDTETRVELRLQLLQVLFVDSALIPNLFKLLRCNVNQFEAAALLQSLLTSSRSPHRRFLIEPLLGHFLPQVDMLGSLLRRHTFKGGPRARGASGKKRQLRLNSYVVNEPLGALSVAAVQILAALSDLAPERTVAAIRPSVWRFLVQSFGVYRCNHIFQAACGRLFIAVIQHGSVRQQQFVFMKLKLLTSLCEAVLTEGTCGDRWHDLRPQQSMVPKDVLLVMDQPHASDTHGIRVEKTQVCVSQKRHPGGLGGITPIVAALLRTQKEAADEVAAAAAAACNQKAGSGDVTDPSDVIVGASGRTPLAPRAGPQSVQEAAPPGDATCGLKVMGQPCQFIAKVLADNVHWPQVVGALSQTVPHTRATCIR